MKKFILAAVLVSAIGTAIGVLGYELCIIGVIAEILRVIISG